ncbi:MAG: phosphate ABC transporter permease subunit PstC [Maricaulis sp.]|jgi:phosphate transport system permease protein|nr:phosphate ABC transporter permease subunit PstC [Maricaulis sp.]MDG2043611.1 phosphate ABC transporter permease subunit PstC [Maricaulis sp.]
MSVISLVALALLVMVAGGFYMGRTRAIKQVAGRSSELHSLPNYYGYYVALWTGFPALLLLAAYGLFGAASTHSWTVAELRAQAHEMSAQFEGDLAANSEYVQLESTLESLELTVNGLREELARLRRANDADRDPHLIQLRLEEQRSSRALLALAGTSIEDYRTGVATGMLVTARETGVAASIRAGFFLTHSDIVRAELFMSDARKIARGETPSELLPELEIVASRLTDHQNTLRNSVGLLVLALAAIALLWTRSQIQPQFRARNNVERLTTVLLIAASILSIITTIGIVLSMLFESMRFFSIIPIQDFLFGLHWSPQIAIREDQLGQSGAFGAIPLFAGTAMITLIAMLVAVPIGLFSAIYLSEYAAPKFRTIAKPVLEVLAGVPTVVFGFFALLTVGPAIRALFTSLGFESAVTQSALSAGLVMGVMIIPFISSLSDDVINAVPQSLRDGSYAMGATRSETVVHVVIPAALPGIFGAVLLAISRAIGETMIVVMAAGQGANLTANPLESVTTITVQIVALLTGDLEFEGPKTLSAFALGLTLFAVTLLMNVIALRVVQKYREKYD